MSRSMFGALRKNMFWASLLGLVVVAAMVIQSLSLVVEGRLDVEKQSDLAASNIASAVEQDIARNLEMYDLSLTGVIQALADPEVARLSGHLRQLALFDNAATATYLNSILVINDKGVITEDSRSLAPTDGDLSDRSYFTAHRDNPNLGLYISEPVRSRFSGGTWIILLSRRISTPDGAFAGVVAGSLQIDYFHALFDSLSVGPRGTIALMKSDGVMITRKPFSFPSIGKNVGDIALFKRYPAAIQGRFTSSSAWDGIERRFFFKQIGNYPLVMTIGIATEDIYAPWRARLLRTFALMSVFLIAITILILLLISEFKRRTAAERELALAAMTDPLTNLANRRSLDATMDTELARARRTSKPLSFLMIDVDYFKAFNDTFGHQSGDAALRLIAGCIRDNIRRPADVAARFGGEEFAVSLPETDNKGALRVAEQIRLAVLAQAIQHCHGQTGLVTVSIGVASISPRANDTVASLIESADGALYRAKRGGRNRVKTAPRPALYAMSA